MIVLDASAAIELVLHTPTGGRVAARLSVDDALHGPHLIDLEVASVLRKLERTRVITPADAVTALDDFAALGLERHAHDLFVPRIWQLRARLTSYDACYVAVAEALGATLVTCDARLAKAKGHGATVALI